MTARPLRPPGRLRVLRPCPGPHLTGRPTAPLSARPRPMAPPRTGRQVLARPRRRPVRCRRSRRRRRPGPAPKPAAPEPIQGPREPQAFRALRAPRGCRDRRGPRSPRPTSVARRRARGAKGARPGPRLRVPARLAAQGRSAQAPPRAVPTRAARAARAVRAARVPGRPRRGPRDLVLPGRVRPGQVDPARVRALRVPAPGRATTRSARPRPAWGQRLPLGLRVRPRPVSPTVPAVPVLRLAARAVPAARVPPGVVRAGPACPTAARVPAGSLVRVPAAPGRAR
jgi:hypothetical protein